MEIIQKSLIQAIIGVGAMALIAYMMVAGLEVPQELWLLLGTVIGFYFGTNAEGARIAAARLHG